MHIHMTEPMMVGEVVVNPEESPNYLRGTLCYTIGNLENADDNEAVSWREYLKTELNPMGIRVISPMDKVFANFELEGGTFKEELFKLMQEHKFEEVHRRMKSIIKKDLRCCDICSFIVGVIDTTRPTWGTVNEILVAMGQSKRIMLVIKPNLTKIPLWLLGLLGPKAFYNSLEEIIVELKELDSGVRKLDEKYWRILEPSLR